MEMTIIGILVFLIICAVIYLSVGYYRYTKLAINRNNVHFYVARDKTGELFLYMGKPFRSIERFHACYNGCIITDVNSFYDFDLNKNNFDNLKWEDEPVEVFLNLEQTNL